MPNDPLRCRHVHTEGRQCGSPALRGEKLCYHHHAARRPLARRTDTELIRPHLPHPEDLHAVQSGIAELLRLISMGHEDHKTHKLLLGTLALASANLARIERNRRAARTLALAEARFAAQHPELASQPVILSEGEAQAEGPAVPGPTPQPRCPTFGAVSPRLRWDRDTTDLITDLAHDPILGTIAPGPDPEPRAEGPVPDPTPLVTHAPAQPSEEENLARWNRAIAKIKPYPIDLDAAAETTPPPAQHGRSPHNPFRMLDRSLKTRKTPHPPTPSAACPTFNSMPHLQFHAPPSIPCPTFNSNRQSQRRQGGSSPHRNAVSCR